MCKRGDHHVLQAAGEKKRPLFWYFFSNVAKRSYILEAAVPFTFFSYFFSWCSPKIMINELPHCLSIPWERGKDRASCEWCASHCYVTLSRYMYVYCSHWHPYIRILWIATSWSLSQNQFDESVIFPKFSGSCISIIGCNAIPKEKHRPSFDLLQMLLFYSNVCK